MLFVQKTVKIFSATERVRKGSTTKWRFEVCLKIYFLYFVSIQGRPNGITGNWNSVIKILIKQMKLNFVTDCSIHGNSINAKYN